MSKQRYIDTAFWLDNYTSNLDPIEKLLFLYIITNPNTNISGIYQIPVRLIAASTGIDKEMVLKVISRFEADNKVKYEDGWIAIKNFIKHQKINPNIEKGIINNLKKAPVGLIEWVFKDSSKGFERLLTPLNYLNLNLNPNLKDCGSNEPRTPEDKKQSGIENQDTTDVAEDSTSLHQTTVDIFYQGYKQLHNETMDLSKKEIGCVVQITQKAEKMHKALDRQQMVVRQKAKLLYEIAKKNNRFQNWRFLPSQMVLHWNDLVVGCILDEKARSPGNQPQKSYDEQLKEQYGGG